jgi:hypothetical protein
MVIEFYSTLIFMCRGPALLIAVIRDLALAMTLHGKCGARAMRMVPKFQIFFDSSFVVA